MTHFATGRVRSRPGASRRRGDNLEHRGQRIHHKSRAHCGCVAGVSFVLLASLNPCFAEDPSAVLREALTLRALAVEAPEAMDEAFATMPAGALGRAPSDAAKRRLVWSFVFRGTLLKLGQLASASPLALHYNPMLDIAVVQACSREVAAKVPRCQELCAIPGEVLTAQRVAAQPLWMTDSEPLTALSRVASARVAAFARDRPGNTAGNSPPWRTSYCKPTYQRVAEMRAMQGLLSLAEVSVPALEAAVRSYATETPLSAGGREPDVEIGALLANMPSLLPSSAVALPSGGWILTFTPKATGWRQIALLADATPAGALRLKSARILAVASEKP